MAQNQLSTLKIKKKRFAKAFITCLFMVLFTQFAQAQEELRMSNGTREVPSNGFKFYDSGGDLLYDPIQDPANANEYNWTTWYQHNEDYTLTLTVPEGKGIKIEFEKLLVNNDYLSFYEGNTASAENLIGTFSNNDYSTAFCSKENKLTIESHGNMTIRFTSDYRWRDEGWVAKITRTDSFTPQPPVAMMAACSNQMMLIPTSKGNDNTLQYKIGETGTYQNLSANAWQSLSNFGEDGLTIITKAIIDGVESPEKNHLFHEIKDPVPPTAIQHETSNSVTVYFPPKPAGVNDTYYVRWIINNNPNGDNEDPRLWPSEGHEFQQPNNTPNTVPAGEIDYTNVGLSTDFYIHLATRGTTCPDIFSPVNTVVVTDLYVPKPTITFVTSGNNGTCTLNCSLAGATIYYTFDGSTPDPEHVGGAYPTTLYDGNGFLVSAGTTVKAIAVKTNFSPSEIASEIFIPGGESGNGQNGIYGNIVLLDDREDHNWSYYSDGDQPIHKLKPADIKITYNGFGTKTMTTTNTDDNPTNDKFVGNVTSSQVAVNVGEPGNQFIYLKTLENADPEGGSTSYPYTMIPNPFQVRPTSGSTNQYRGFYAWRVKSMSNGLIIKVGTNEYTSDNIASGIILYSDQEIEFITENVYGNEVEFEALWAQAYVVTSNATTNLHSGVTYERNFVVGATNVSPINMPVTYSSYYPNGDNSGTTSTVNRNFKCSNNTKFENLNINGVTFTANNHDLIMGRGLTNTATLLQGIDQFVSGNTNYGALNYTLRVESGIYTQLAFVRDGNAAVTGEVQVRAILGSDYDRADFPEHNPNQRLQVSKGNTLYYSRRVQLQSSNNKNKKTFDCVIKSGQYQENYWTGNGADGNSDHNLYCGPNNGGSNTYPGIRYITIEGGKLASMNGGRGTDDNTTNNETNHAATDVVNFYVRIKGGIFNGSVFGGASDNHSNGGKQLVITGGTIRGWVAGGANGTGTGSSGSMATTLGDSYVYVGGNALIGSTGNDAMEINHTLGGQVFGAGRGAKNGEGNWQTASVYNSYVVVADNATISSGTKPNGGNVYGGGNLGVVTQTTNVYILGGTIQNNVFGGAYGNGVTNTAIPTSNVYIKGNNTTINGNVYGGSNSNGTVTNSHVTMMGGTTNNVFGGGLGASGTITIYTGTNGTNTPNNVSHTGTSIGHEAYVNIMSGTVNNNVYGGGEEGTVTGITNVSVSGGTMKNVYGAGKGNATATPALTADITGQTIVNVSGGTMNNVYGGGEAGNVIENNATDLASTVTIQGGIVNEDVFGGGRMGLTTGNVVVNVYGGDITGNVYGGAFGRRGTETSSGYVPSVFIAGTHTVNITGGNVYTNVYGGSRNADDALSFNPDPTNSTQMAQAVNRVNISGGHVYYQVFAGGYFGHTYGSVYAFVGQNAIKNAPNHAPTSTVTYNAAALLIDGSVWAGADFGNFDGYSFGDATIEGHSNVYIDGKDYNTVSTQPSDAGYMNIGSSVLGSGTSCYAGLMGSELIIRNYGQPVTNPNYSKDAIVEPYLTATRNLKSIQFFNTVDFDNAHLQLIGQGRINSLTSTEKYSVYGVGTPAKKVGEDWIIAPDILRMVNGSSLFIDFPMDQVMRLGSYTCTDVYAASPSYVVVNYSDLSAPNHDQKYDNKFRVNNGAYLNVKYIGAYNPSSTSTGWDYGELIGYFYMMTDDENHTCAYARPKQSKDQGNQIPTGYDNPLDGGFLSYNNEKNSFTAGLLTLVNEHYVFNVIADAPGDGTPGVQMPYENHTLDTKNGEQYFRIWRYGGKFSYRQGVFNAVAKTTAGYSTADVVISLPAQHGTNSYFRIKTDKGFPMIDYGDDVMTVNAGIYNSTDGVPAADGWMYYNVSDHNFVLEQDSVTLRNALAPLQSNPNVNFGLVAIPQGSLNGSENGYWLFCNDSGDDSEALATASWRNVDNITNPSIRFRLTYNNLLTNNATWDPIIITLEQYTLDGSTVTVTDEIKIALSVSTITTINQDFGTQVFAMMNGEGTQANTFTAKVVLPGFIPFVNTEGDLSNWTFVKAEWKKAEDEFADAWQKGSDYVTNPVSNYKFSMQIVPAPNFDNTVGWNSYDHTAKDLKTIASGTHLAYTDGRNPAAFDFILHYDGRATCTDKEKLGDLEVTLHFTNLKGDTPGVAAERDLLITIEVYRRGTGSVFFLDGVNGNNFFDGVHPNAAKKTLTGIYNRTEPPYTPGDIIFVVNTVTAEGASALDWNGELYGQVVLYRYPGGHAKYESTDPSEVYTGYDDYNPGNKGFTGPLVNVKNAMNMHGIVLDGAYNIVTATPLNSTLVPNASTYQTPDAPLINIEANGVLTVYANSKLQWNHTNSNGGAVYNAGRMYIRSGSDIQNNQLLSDSYFGGGVYLKNGATLIVSDSITINNNHRIVNSASKNSNVYLEGENSVIQVGTVMPNDGLDALVNHLTDGTGLKSAKIGVSKAAWPDYSYNPIAYTDGGGTTYLGNLIPSNPDDTPARDYIIFDDDLYYKLVSLNNTPGYEPSTDFLFWVGTWVTAVREEPSGFSPTNIDSPEDLAWAISYVNGLNNSDPHYNAELTVTADIDMNANIWVPIGTSSHPYTGTFDAKGHVIKGVKSSLNDENMGMFGTFGGTKVGTIKNMILNVNFTGGSSVRMGSVAAVMLGGSINNVETAGIITGTSTTTTMGGIVGQNDGGVIHSSFAVNSMTAMTDATVMGGLVGTNSSNLFNSYANTSMSGSEITGGLAGVNNGIIENCYVVLDKLGKAPIPTFPAFAYQNNGDILYCYANEDNGYVNVLNSTKQPIGHGLYGAVKDRKEIGYMYDDNDMTDVLDQWNDENENHPYVAETIKYKDGHFIEAWNGLLSTLNQWVAADPRHINKPTPWFRPTSDKINGDLPVLGFPSDNCLGTTNADGKYLVYGSTDNNANGLDQVLHEFNEKDGDPASSLFLYGKATEVTQVPEGQVKVFVNEDAVLIQADGADDFINTTVGVTFDNSCHSAQDFFNNDLAYDWHLMSSPLKDAPIGTTYSNKNESSGDYEPDLSASPTYSSPVDISGMVDSYFPNELTMGSGYDTGVKWDFYCFYEPEYHWINLKRNRNNHFHYDAEKNPGNTEEYQTDAEGLKHYRVNYNGNDQATNSEGDSKCFFIPGKGYMMAISQDSYMSSTGTLNKGNVSIDVTKTVQNPDWYAYYDQGANLIGNPYQAYLDLEAVAAGNPYTVFFVYIAEEDQYKPYVKNQSLNTQTPSRYIHPHQGFFVQKAESGTEQITFTKTMATADKEDHSYFRGEHVDYPLINLLLENAEGTKNYTIIEVNRPETGGAGRVETLNNANFDLYARYEGQDYKLLFTPEGEQRVAVFFKTTEDNTYTFTWDIQNGKFDQLTLIDNVTGAECDMLAHDHYSFEGHATDYAARFYVVFHAINPEDEVETDVFAFFNGSGWMVKGQGQLDLMDVTGRVLSSQYVSGDYNTVHYGQFAAGVYVLRLGEKTQKIVIR